MPRAEVTKELGETLRNLRMQNGVLAKDLATHLNKSAAFISKLENASIQTIDVNELYSILKYITSSKDDVELADKIYKSLNIKYSPKEIEEQLWFQNFETVECKLPIPSDLIDDFNARIDKLNLSRSYLLSRINANEALSQEEINDSSIAVNHWYRSPNPDGSQNIKISLSEELYNSILDKETDISSYIFVLSIAYYLNKIDKYGISKIDLSPEETSDLMNDTYSQLQSHHFLTTTEKNYLLAEKKTEAEQREILNSFDMSNLELINSILKAFRFATDVNIKRANEYLSGFNKNLEWDLGFVMKLISLEFYDLDKLSVSNKRKLLSDIYDLIEKYKNLPEKDNSVEEY